MILQVWGKEGGVGLGDRRPQGNMGFPLDALAHPKPLGPGYRKILILPKLFS